MLLNHHHHHLLFSHSLSSSSLSSSLRRRAAENTIRFCDSKTHQRRGNPLIIKGLERRTCSSISNALTTTRNKRKKCSRMRLWTEDDPPGGEPETIKNNFEPNPEQFLLTSVTFYVVMTAFSQTGCTYLNIHPDLFAQIFVFNPDVATIWSVPLLLSLAMVLLVDERVEFVKEVKELMVDGVIPNVAPTGANGILMLSLGAGIGEEALFRGFLMPLLSNGILERGLGGTEVATYASLGVTSVIFGALHAITPAYQIWATLAGFLFGWEYLNDGLGSAMFTHCFYDFIAFAFIILLWGKPKQPSSSSSSEAGKE
jgi:membrane protease YdiL (CAAX protease family)